MEILKVLDALLTEIEEKVIAKASVREENPADEYEKGFDHGYDFKQEEVLRVLSELKGRK